MLHPVVKDDVAYIKKAFGGSADFAGRHIIITGAAGFLGYYFTQYFLDLYRHGGDLAPASLTLMDTYIVGKPAWVDEIEAEFADDKNIRLLQFDITKDDYAGLPGIDKADYVIHLASIASPVYYRKYPVETLNANVLGLSRLLEFYTSKGLKGLLFLSSSEIYGDPDAAHIPTNEEYRGYVSCTGPRACYDEAKRVGETMCAIYAQTRGVPVRVARPFNNYGPGMSINDKRAPADFAKAVLENRNIVMHSDGSPTRTFCYVADAIVGYLKVLTHTEYDYFNIGMDMPEISIRQLAEAYVNAGRELFGYTGRAVFQPSGEAAYLTDNPQRRCPDIAKARQVLGYEPKIMVEDGLRRYLMFLKEGDNSLG